MSTFKKYLSIINEGGYLNANDDPREIANLNKNELSKINPNNTNLASNNNSNITELDDAGEVFIENIVKYVKNILQKSPTTTKINTHSRFTLPNLNPKLKRKFVGGVGPRELGEDLIKNDKDVIEYKELLTKRLLKKLNNMINKEKLGKYIKDLTLNNIEIVEDNTGNSNANNGYKWYSIDMDFEGINRRPGEEPTYGVKRSYTAGYSSKDTQNSIDNMNRARHDEIRSNNEASKKRSAEIAANNKKNNPPTNYWGSKNNRERIEGKKGKKK